MCHHGIPGIHPDYTAADFKFINGSNITSVSIDPRNIHLTLSDTCTQCVGGESIELNIATAPVLEPASIALLSAGLAAIAWRRGLSVRWLRM
jgi:hypothetical protein